MARAHEVTRRTLRNWKQIDPAERRAPPGRPRLSEEVLRDARRRVAAELDRQGWDAGEEPIWRGLQKAIPKARVRRVLRELKAERRRRRAGHAREARVHVAVRGRDVLWCMDATHLGRDSEGKAVQAEVLRDVASTRTIGLSVGPPATVAEVIDALSRAVLDRGGPPLVLATDNGAAYRSDALARWCRERKVLQLFSLPRTPQHNAWAEHGIGELKRDAELSESGLVLDIGTARARLEASRARIDGNRLRCTRGWMTAIEADDSASHWSTNLQRETLFDTATCAIDRAMINYPRGRDRRRAIREAILNVLERYALIKRNRGDPAQAAQFAESVS